MKEKVEKIFKKINYNLPPDATFLDMALIIDQHYQLMELLKKENLYFPRKQKQ